MTPIPFYLAGPFSQREAVRAVRTQLEASGGLQCISRWIDSHLDTDDHSPAILRIEAQHDLEDIRNAQWVILWNGGVSTSGGMHFECGYALALRKVVIVIGNPTSIFYHLPELTRVDTVADVLPFIPKWLYDRYTRPRIIDSPAV